MRRSRCRRGLHGEFGRLVDLRVDGCGNLLGRLVDRRLVDFGKMDGRCGRWWAEYRGLVNLRLYA